MAHWLQTLQNAVIDGDKGEVESLVNAALSQKQPAEEILNAGLIAAMKEVGERFERGDFYVPEMLVAARAMQAGLAIIKPHLSQGGVKSAGVVVIGTVKGDLHDIGKNLVVMMLESAGFEIVDLGTDVAPEGFVQAVKEYNPNLIGMSALLTTTMTSMKTTLHALQEAGLRERVKVMVGGAPVTEDFAREIGADGYAPDASRAVSLARSLAAG
ncbi:MAG: corrinoid protein [Anaerolineales bacterium]|nr:corrinoid protein [Anaerolineales bacterium]